MRTGAGLALICLGAILAFAVTGNTSFLNVHTAGWVLMIVGVAGLVLPRRTYSWLGRRVLVRRTYPEGRVEEIPLPPYLAAGLPPRPTLLDDPAADLVDAEAERRAAGMRTGYGPPPDGTATGAGTGTRVIDDLYEQP
jgi:hypothetical protein